MPRTDTAEHRRLADSEARRADWKNWGPYVSDRAWGTVREDYSATGEAWDYLPHDHARSRAYRWNEDGIGGFCNRFQNVCLGVALWNAADPILKERLFGVTGSEGNHGEDVKELYFYLDGTPTHSLMTMLYKYPQVAYPYEDLVAENGRRGREEPEYELVDALRDPLAEGRYFDVTIAWAKAKEDDLLCRIEAVNRGPDAAPLHILPHLWFRNTWSWGHSSTRPSLEAIGPATVRATHKHLADRVWTVRAGDGPAPALLFTENDTNMQRLFGTANPTSFVKDGINDAVVNGQIDRVNPDGRGTKVAAHVQRVVPAGGSLVVDVRFAPEEAGVSFADFDAVLERRNAEADEFYAAIQGAGLTAEERMVHRQALAGLLWSKQFYHYSVELWIDGDAAQPDPPASRRRGRNADWRHLYCLDVLSMPDKWEYPWFAAWDLAFHVVPLALVDPEWAKRQLTLLLREWYMHPNGQIPAYEWALSDVNPPVHAWAALQVYKIERDSWGRADTVFLERVFQKLLLNFTWWVNRRDADGNNVFQGGFLGLDNIGVFDRSQPLPTGGHLEQADGTAWMAMYCLNLLAMALELAKTRPAYEDVATKFFEHFIYIAHGFYHLGAHTHDHGHDHGHDHAHGLWDEEDGFFYDVLHAPDDSFIPLKIRSFVGLIPLFAVAELDPKTLERLPRFRRRMDWFLKYRPRLVESVPVLSERPERGATHLAIVDRHTLERILERLLDTEEFLSDYGLRALSRHHLHEPYVFEVDGHPHRVTYEPGESSSGLFGGNSNWRGPIWLPVNYLLLESLSRYASIYGDDLRVECPRGSGNELTLTEVVDEISGRLVRIFLSDPKDGGRRPVFGGEPLFQTQPSWRDHVLFYEYFNGDDGAGIGASHQTGWTALIANLIQRRRQRT